MFELTIKELKEIMVVMAKSDTKSRGQYLEVVAHDNGTVEFIAGLEPAISKTVEAFVSSPGRATIQYDDLKKLTPKLKGTIKFEFSQEDLILKSGKISLKLMAIDTTYPVLSTTLGFTVPTENFIATLKTVLHSISLQESRPVLTAVHMDIINNNLQMTTTDSHRLSRNQTELSSINTVDFELNPHGPSLKKFSEIKNLGENLSVSFTDDKEFFVIDDGEGTKMTLKNMHGNYPNTDRLIPSSHNTELSINVNELVENLDVIEIVAKKAKNYAAKFEMNGHSALKANDGKVLETDIELPAYQGEEIEISFNPTYLKQALQTYEKNEEVEIRFQSSVRPFVVQLGNNIQLITPIRVH